MSLNHLVQRLSITRTNIPPVEIDSDLSIPALKKRQQTKESQQNLQVTDRCKIVFERMLVKRQKHRLYYQDNKEKITRQARENYHRSPERKRKKYARHKIWKAKNKNLVRIYSANWRANNHEKVKENNRQAYEKRKHELTPEEFNAWQKARNRKAIEKKVSELGYDEYRKQENARLKEWRENLSPEKIEAKRAKSREQSRKAREKIKQSPEALENYRAYQAEYQRNRRAKLKQKKEK